MMILIEILLIIIGLILLSLSLSRHYSYVTNQKKPLSKRTIWLLRTCGYSLLIIAIAFAMSVWGMALGALYWCATITLVGMVLSMLLAFKYQP